jgi:hypothetical protein
VKSCPKTPASADQLRGQQIGDLIDRIIAKIQYRTRAVLNARPAVAIAPAA